MVEKVADLEYAFADLEGDVGKIRLAHSGGDQRVHDVAHEGRDDSRERGADNDRNRQIHHISAQNEITKTLQHHVLLRSSSRACRGVLADAPAAYSHATRRN